MDNYQKSVTYKLYVYFLSFVLTFSFPIVTYANTYSNGNKAGWVIGTKVLYDGLDSIYTYSNNVKSVIIRVAPTALLVGKYALRLSYVGLALTVLDLAIKLHNDNKKVVAINYNSQTDEYVYYDGALAVDSYPVNYFVTDGAPLDNYYYNTYRQADYYSACRSAFSWYGKPTTVHLSDKAFRRGDIYVRLDYDLLKINGKYVNCGVNIGHETNDYDLPLDDNGYYWETLIGVNTPANNDKVRPLTAPADQIGEKIIELANQGNEQAKKLLNEISDHVVNSLVNTAHSDVISHTTTARPATIDGTSMFLGTSSVSTVAGYGTSINESTRARPATTTTDATTTTATETTTATDTTTAKPAPDVKDKETPRICSLAPIVCDTAIAVRDSIYSLVSYASTSENTNLDIDLGQNTQAVDTNINLASGCPQSITLFNFSIKGYKFSYDFSFDSLCNALSTYLKPIVIGSASLSAIYIVAGVRRDD